MSKYIELQNELQLLNAESMNERLENLKKLIAEEKERPAIRAEYANNTNKYYTSCSFYKSYYLIKNIF